MRFCVFLKRQDGSAPKFFHDFGKNTCSMHPAFTTDESDF